MRVTKIAILLEIDELFSMWSSGEMFAAVCNLGLEGIVSKKLDAPYRSGPSKTWVKVKNPRAPAATRAIDGTF